MKCPRCSVPVRGEYKYCPECACRLRPGSPAPEEEAPAGRQGPLLLGLVAAALVAGGILVGWHVLGDRAEPTHPQTTPSTHYLSVADIPEHVAAVPEGIAYWQRETAVEAPADDVAEERLLRGMGNGALGRFAADAARRPARLVRWSRLVRLFYARTRDMMIEKVRHVPIRTKRLRVMRYEISRGQWAEFLRSLEQDPKQLFLRKWVEEFIRPAPNEKGEFPEWALSWRGEWWRSGEDRLRVRLEREYPDPETRPALEPPAIVTDTDMQALSDGDAVKLLYPPSWLRLSPEGALYWVMEEGTEDLPVTDISWWDAQIFVEWARQRLGIPSLRMPNWPEWVRTYHGNHPEREPDDYDEKGDPGWKWPWGNVIDRHGCNNLNHSWNDPVPVLRDVRKPYGWHEGDTVDGVMNMAGNAAEWVRGWDPQPLREGGEFYVPVDWRGEGDKKGEGDTDRAFACGGSYLDGLDDCSVKAHVSLRKTERHIEVGFRLVYTPGSF